jgi:ribosome biogenesis protein BRX1
VVLENSRSIYALFIYHIMVESKLDTKKELDMLNELADMNNCHSCMFLETRRHEDLYMWLSKTPNGPCAKFLILNIHTMNELQMTGNHLKGSRPLLSFDKTFGSTPSWKLIKELLVHTFNIPRGHPKSKPFFDHIFSFTIVEGRIWFRNFQIVDEEAAQPMNLIEVGPRFVLWPIRVLAGSFDGPTLYANPDYISPQEERRELRTLQSHKYIARKASKTRRRQHRDAFTLSGDELDDVFDG